MQFLFQFQSCLHGVNSGATLPLEKHQCNPGQSPCFLGSVNPGFYRELWRHQERLTHPFQDFEDNGARENAQGLGWTQTSLNWNNEKHLKGIASVFFFTSDVFLGIFIQVSNGVNLFHLLVYVVLLKLSKKFWFMCCYQGSWSWWKQHRAQCAHFSSGQWPDIGHLQMYRPGLRALLYQD